MIRVWLSVGSFVLLDRSQHVAAVTCLLPAPHCSAGAKALPILFWFVKAFRRACRRACRPIDAKLCAVCRLQRI